MSYYPDARGIGQAARHLATELTNHTVVTEHTEELLFQITGKTGYGQGRHRAGTK